MNSMNRPLRENPRIQDARPLPPPGALAGELPLDDTGADFIAHSRRAVEAIVLGRDDRLIVVAGPCSIHDPAAALEYARRLRGAAERHAAELHLVMRAYVEKPRTIIGWKGLTNDPLLDGSHQIDFGLRLARKLMLDLVGLRVPAAAEFLDPTLGQYYADLVAWGVIGARTVESQVHRAMASGLPMPVGVKNRTDGDVKVAIDALVSVRHAHWYAAVDRVGRPAMLGTSGNRLGHLVLRGGSRGPNYSPDHVRTTVDLLRAAGLPPRLMVDCSHGNSRRDPDRQPAVAASLAEQIAAGQHALCGVMLESNLVAGTQDSRHRPLVYGRSVTDPCLAWEKTAPVLDRLAAAVRERRARSCYFAPRRPQQGDEEEAAVMVSPGR